MGAGLTYLLEATLQGSKLLSAPFERGGLLQATLQRRRCLQATFERSRLFEFAFELIWLRYCWLGNSGQSEGKRAPDTEKYFAGFELFDIFL